MRTHTHIHTCTHTHPHTHRYTGERINWIGGWGWSLAVIGSERNKCMFCPLELGGFSGWRLHASGGRWRNRRRWSCRAHIQLFLPQGEAYLSQKNKAVQRIPVLNVQMYKMATECSVRALKRPTEKLFPHANFTSCCQICWEILSSCFRSQ